MSCCELNTDNVAQPLLVAVVDHLLIQVIEKDFSEYFKVLFDERVQDKFVIVHENQMITGEVLLVISFFCCGLVLNLKCLSGEYFISIFIHIFTYTEHAERKNVTIETSSSC